MSHISPEAPDPRNQAPRHAKGWLGRSGQAVLGIAEHALNTGTVPMADSSLEHGIVSAETERAHTFGELVQSGMGYAYGSGAHFEEADANRLDQEGHITTGLRSEDGSSIIVLTGPANPPQDGEGVFYRTEAAETRYVEGREPSADSVLATGNLRAATEADREKFFSGMLGSSPRVVSERIVPHAHTAEDEVTMRREVRIASDKTTIDPKTRALHTALGEDPAVTFVAPLSDTDIRDLQLRLKKSRPVLKRQDLKKLDKKIEKTGEDEQGDWLIAVSPEEQELLKGIVPADILQVRSSQRRPAPRRRGREAAPETDAACISPVGQTAIEPHVAVVQVPAGKVRVSAAEQSIRRALGQS